LDSVLDSMGEEWRKIKERRHNRIILTDESKDIGDVKFKGLVLYYPITDHLLNNDQSFL